MTKIRPEENIFLSAGSSLSRKKKFSLTKNSLTTIKGNRTVAGIKVPLMK